MRMRTRRSTSKCFKVWVLATDNTVLFIKNGAVKIKLRKIRNCFDEAGEKDYKNRRGNKLFR